LVLLICIPIYKGQFYAVSKVYYDLV